MTTEIQYRLEPNLSPEEFIAILQRSTLSERRPLHNLQQMAGMVKNADLIITARNAAGLLVGVSRALTDFSYSTYLADLAVDVAFQRQGIGRQLIQRTHAEAGLHTSLILVAAPLARSYYPHIGMRAHDSCWLIDANACEPEP